MADQASSSSGSSGMSMGGGQSYSGYAQAGASTLGIILDGINNANARRENRRLNDLAFKMAMLQRQDTLKQQDIQNKQASQQLGLLQKKTNFEMGQSQDAMNMTKIKSLTDTLKEHLTANPSLVTGMRTLFSSGV